MSKLPGHEGESLQSLLITPVQRIPRYNLLLSVRKEKFEKITKMILNGQRK
jgi:hypothetical protein